ncbi:tetratricopeptide repeat protein [bacterium]|nr:tetratricopeptide repeat protein [bacterium]
MVLLIPRISDGMEENRSAALQLYQEGLFQETGTGDLKMAIEIYTTLIKKYSDYSDISAVGHYHLGLAHEKLGNYPAAKKHYQTITRLYGKHKNIIQQAQNKLKQLSRRTAKRKTPVRDPIPPLPDTPHSQIPPVKSAAPSASGPQTKTWGIGINYWGLHARYRTPDRLQLEIKAQSRAEDLLLGVRGAFVSQTIPLAWTIGLEYDYVFNTAVTSKYITGAYVGGEISLTQHLGWGGDIGYYYLNTQINSQKIIAMETAATIYLTWYF